MRDRNKVGEFSGEFDEKEIMQAIAGDGVMKAAVARTWVKFTESMIFLPMLALLIILVVDFFLIPASSRSNSRTGTSTGA